MLAGTEMHDAHMLSCGSVCTSRASSCVVHGLVQLHCIQHSNVHVLLIGVVVVVVVVAVAVVVVVVVVVDVPWPTVSGSC